MQCVNQNKELKSRYLDIARMDKRGLKQEYSPTRKIYRQMHVITACQ